MYTNSYNYGGYDYSGAAAAAATTGTAMAIFMIILYALWYILLIAWVVLYIVGMWKTFTRMGLKGYYSLIGGYNEVLLLEAADMPLWNYFIINFVPIYGLIVSIKRGIVIANKFGKSTAVGVLLGIPFTAPIAFMILGCAKDAKYKG